MSPVSLRPDKGCAGVGGALLTVSRREERLCEWAERGHELHLLCYFTICLCRIVSLLRQQTAVRHCEYRLASV
jgi:hypothetical protein